MNHVTNRLLYLVILIMISSIIEVSQLYHAEWIDNLRNTYLGELILGSSFVWGDLVAYSCGTGLAILIDYLIKSYRK
jgi:hypothetical protein